MKTIGISLHLEDAFDQSVVMGVVRYSRTRQDVTLRGSGGGLRPLAFSGADRCDAVIARIESAEAAQEFASLGVPVIDIAGGFPHDAIHRIQNDEYGTGVMAASYLARIGTPHYAWCGVEGASWSRQRQAGYFSALARPYHEVPVFERPLLWWKDTRQDGELCAWLERLRAATGIFCCNDIAGSKVSAHCRDLGLKVPGHISILGVDNEELRCELSSPRLSSIRLDCMSIGFRAMERAYALLENRGDSSGMPDVVLVPCLDIVERESTSSWSMEQDSVVSRAMRYIVENLSAALRIEDIARACAVSRRTVELRFRTVKGMSVLDAIQEERLRRCRSLLAETDEKLESIAAACGFPSVQRLHVLFKRVEKTTPRQWRRANRRG